MKDHNDDDDPISAILRCIKYPLYQDKMWTTADKRRLTIEEMSASHRYNLLEFLRRRAKIYATNDAIRLMVSNWRIDLEEVASRCDNPLEWLESMPLVKRLIDLVEQDMKSDEVWF